MKYSTITNLSYKASNILNILGADIITYIGFAIIHILS